ncbi:hypothetical protein CK203_020102 [Vitis vinifera]|uniref:Uncharacterized protein n=1 Tax=Vitis vinifera TaxID=29760 RepID=A0A438J8B4_VITVI|nr:hypothetical protein CK203_020102 [Vitis vinifera]
MRENFVPMILRELWISINIFIGDMLEAIQYLVSSKKLEDGFGMVNVALVNGGENHKIM